MARPAESESWGHSTVQTACPLDCPDSCTLQITVEKGRIVEIDGGHENPSTRGYICGKVRRFAERVYGEDRLLYPAVRKGTKGDGVFTRVSWDEALDHIAERMMAIRDRSGAEAILPFCYGGSNGLLTQDTNDAALWRGFGTSRLARTVCAAATGAANMGLYGKMPGVTYEDYVHARLIVLWGVNPSASGIHLIPFIKEARQAGAKLVVVDPRATALARQADLHIPVRPGTDVAVALALHKYLFDNGYAAEPFLAEHARGVDELRARAEAWPMARAAEVAELDLADLERFAELYASSSPAVVRCGWGLERNRNGGSAVAAVLALPAVAGKFGVRGGGFTMSNSTALGIKAATWMNDTPEPNTRIVNMNKLGDALLDYTDPRVEMLFVYNCNPLATMPHQNRVLEGLRRSDLFTVVFDQVVTDTARFADVLLPATTFVENYDIAKGYGPISLQLVRPVIEPAGETRSNPTVFADLANRLGLGNAEEEIETLLKIAQRLPAGDWRRTDGAWRRHSAVQRPADSVRRRVSADARRERSTCFLRRSIARRPPGSTRSSPTLQRSSTRSRSFLRPARRRSRRCSASCASARACCRCTPRTPKRGDSPQTTPCASSTSAAKCSAPSPSPRTCGRARSAFRRACGGRAPTTGRRRTRSRQTRSPTSAPAPASTTHGSRSRCWVDTDESAVPRVHHSSHWESLSPLENAETAENNMALRARRSRGEATFGTPTSGYSQRPDPCCPCNPWL